MRIFGVPGFGSDIVEAMCALAKSDYEFVDVTGFDEDSSARDVLIAVNPLAQVPVLELDDGTIMTETAAIALLLDERRTGLLPPPGSAGRALALRLLVWLVANVYPTFTYGDYPERWAPSAPRELIDSTDRHRQQLYLWLEEQVVGPWVLGAEVSVLDCYVATMIDWRPRRGWFEEHTPRLAGIAQRIRSDPMFARVFGGRPGDRTS